MTTTTKSYELVGGPQDGGRVKPVGGAIPVVIYVGPRPLGDGYVAYGVEPCDRFPHRYVVAHSDKFVYEGTLT